MKKLVTLFATILAMTPVAFAGSLNLDTRVDYQSINYNTEVGQPNYSHFYFKTGRLDYKGKVNDDLSFRVRWAFNKDSSGKSVRENTFSAVELGYITQKMSDVFSLSVGKYNTEFGGWEGATSSPDLYLTSEFYTGKGVNGSNLADTTLNASDLRYMTGAKAQFTFADQNIWLMTANADKDEVDGAGKFQQNYTMNGLAWKGGFLDKALNFAASYHMMNRSENDKYAFMAAGIKWDAKPIYASLDYLVSAHETTGTDNLTSIVGKLAYTGMENWIPRLEVTSSEEKQEIGVNQTTKFMGYGAVLEYVPSTENVFRYHAAYNMTTEEPPTGNNKERTEFVVGARLMADFLK